MTMRVSHDCHMTTVRTRMEEVSKLLHAQCLVAILISQSEPASIPIHDLLVRQLPMMVVHIVVICEGGEGGEGENTKLKG